MRTTDRTRWSRHKCRTIWKRIEVRGLQAEMAAKFKVSPSTVHLWVNAKADPAPRWWPVIADFFEVPVTDLTVKGGKR